MTLMTIAGEARRVGASLLWALKPWVTWKDAFPGTAALRVIPNTFPTRSMYISVALKGNCLCLAATCSLPCSAWCKKGSCSKFDLSLILLGELALLLSHIIFFSFPVVLGMSGIVKQNLLEGILPLYLGELRGFSDLVMKWWSKTTGSCCSEMVSSFCSPWWVKGLPAELSLEQLTQSAQLDGVCQNKSWRISHKLPQHGVCTQGLSSLAASWRKLRPVPAPNCV